MAGPAHVLSFRKNPFSTCVQSANFLKVTLTCWGYFPVFPHWIVRTSWLHKDETPGPDVDVREQGQSLFSYPLPAFCHLPHPSLHIHSNNQRNANLQRLFQVSSRQRQENWAVIHQIPLNFRNRAVRLQTLLHHLLGLRFPHNRIPSLECKSNPVRELNLLALVLRTGLHETLFIFKPETTAFPHCLQIQSSNVGWTLGYMLNLTNMIPAEEPLSAPLSHSTYVFLMVLFSLILVAGVIVGLCFFYKPSYFWKDVV